MDSFMLDRYKGYEKTKNLPTRVKKSRNHRARQSGKIETRRLEP